MATFLEAVARLASHTPRIGEYRNTGLMPKVVYKFQVEHHPQPVRERGSLVLVSSVDVFKQIGNLGYDYEWRPPPSEGAYSIVDEEQASRLAETLRLIKCEVGLVPKTNTVMRPDERRYQFSCHKTRSYTRRELDDAELLCINYAWLPWGKMQRRFIGPGLDRQEDDETWVVKVDIRQKNKLQIGLLEGHNEIVVAAEMKERFEMENLIGLEFSPIKLEPADRVKKSLWHFWSHVTLPSTLLPLQHQDGTDFTGDLSRGCYPDDGGYFPVELRYRHSEIAKLGNFDVAITRERFGGTHGPKFRKLVVSQRFREVAEKLKVDIIQFVPVRFLD